MYAELVSCVPLLPLKKGIQLVAAINCLEKGKTI